jgi:two-component system OmpR family sensor kinase
VFDAFYQVDTSSNRKHAGVGLGLAIVRGIVDAHGGTIVVESAQPQGTEVIVTLPVAPPGSVIPPSPATGGAP